MMLYQIKIPAALYEALAERDALHNDNDTDRAALAVFKAAVAKKSGPGYSYILTGEGETITYLLTYIHSLIDAVQQGVYTTAEVGGLSARRLEYISLQPRIPVPPTPPGASA